jgi:hypothetical protein
MRWSYYPTAVASIYIERFPECGWAQWYLFIILAM